LIHILVEASVNAETTALIEPVKIEVFFITIWKNIRNLYYNLARLEKIDLIDFISSLNN
jgi:hypothetical protein